jgi:hypothetical protein
VCGVCVCVWVCVVCVGVCGVWGVFIPPFIIRMFHYIVKYYMLVKPLVVLFNFGFYYNSL